MCVCFFLSAPVLDPVSDGNIKNIYFHFLLIKVMCSCNKYFRCKMCISQLKS